MIPIAIIIAAGAVLLWLREPLPPRQTKQKRDARGRFIKG